MSDQAAMILRFDGDPDDLLERFQNARRLWTESRDEDFSRPTLHVILRTEDGIVIVNGYPNAEQAHMFGRSLGRT